MNETLKSLTRQLAEFWKKQSRKMKTVYISSIVGIILLSLVLAMVLNQSNLVVLYTGLDTAESNEIMARLSEMDIAATMDQNSTIYVPKESEASLKMQLSVEGYPKSALSYDIFTENTDFLTTDFEKSQYLIFQLQDRLQAAILYLNQISSAVVTLNIPDQDSYVLQDDKIAASASVLVKLKGGEELTSGQVKGIVQLVTKSVPGLETENVSLIDGEGNQLNSDDGGTGLDAVTRLELEKQADERIKAKINTILQPVFGADGYTVAVNSTLDFDQMISEEITYSPVVGNTGIVSKEDKTNEIQGGTATDAATGVAGTEANADVPTYETTTGAEGADYSNSTYSAEYLVNQIKKQIQNDGGSIKSLMVAVVIDQADMTAEQKTELTNMIAYAAGTTSENVALTNMAFAPVTPPEETVEPTGIGALIPAGMEWLLYVIGGAALLFIILIIIIILLVKKNSKKNKSSSAGSKHDNQNEAVMQTHELKPLEIIPGAIPLSETREQVLKKEIGDFSSNNPEIVAQLIRTWLKGDR